MDWKYPNDSQKQGQLDFLNVIRGRIHTDADLTNVIPVQGMQSAPHLDFAGEVKKTYGNAHFSRF